MAKRLTDSKKWDDDWFLNLSPEHKLLWIYILDKCDHAGVFKVTRKLAEFCLGHQLDWDAVEAAFSDRVIKISEDKWFIPKFLTFQYGKLNPDNKIHKGIIAILESKGIDTLSIEYRNSIYPVEVKVKVKDKVKVRAKAKAITYKEDSNITEVVDAIITDLNEVLNTAYKLSSVKTRELIRIRLKEGFSLDNFKKVHRTKHREWSTTDMKKYLRPETLYSNKFEGYLNQDVDSSDPLRKYEVIK